MGLEQLHTYSIDCVDNNRYFKASKFQPADDAPWVKLVSECLKTHHHYIVIDTPKLVDALTDAVRARDLPGMADIDSLLYLFCKEIKKNATVVLSGECADEIFGGYPWFHSQELHNFSTFPLLQYTQKRVKLLSNELVEIIQPEEYIQQRFLETIKETPALPGEDPLEARKRQVFYLNITWFMATLLDRKDRMSMASGLEVRVPFCDHRLVEYAWNIPWEMKTCDQKEKGILRRALEGILPVEVLNRRKSPYPKIYNPNYLTAVRNWLEQILEDPMSPILPFININSIRSLMSDKDSFDRPWFGQLMTDPQLLAYLCQVNTWLKEYNVKIL